MTLRMLSAPAPRLMIPRSRRPMITRTASRAPISRSCKLARVVTSANPPARLSAMSASPRSCHERTAPPGNRSRHMYASCAGAT